MWPMSCAYCLSSCWIPLRRVLALSISRNCLSYLSDSSFSGLSSCSSYWSCSSFFSSSIPCSDLECFPLVNREVSGDATMTTSSSFPDNCFFSASVSGSCIILSRTLCSCPSTWPPSFTTKRPISFLAISSSDSCLWFFLNRLLRSASSSFFLFRSVTGTGGCFSSGFYCNCSSSSSISLSTWDFPCCPTSDSLLPCIEGVV